MRIPESYEVIENRRIEDLDSESFLLRHKKTGARLAILSNDDDNKVFYIGFRTPPADSTGVAHIIEHTVLCGSKKYPVKDPFVELAKGSLNTFLNAMTYPDKTVYPVASCNDADFGNLMNVYLDAVFYPNIYRESKIFRQEGWHYELENEDDELKINGVVYNEMKGAFSSPDDVLERQVLNSLYPDTTYGIESGGDPDVIPELTYEDYLDFHRRYYHPSNSYIYLYGNMDVEEKLEFLDREYLSAFEALEIDSEIKLQKPFEKRSEKELFYPIMPDEDEAQKTYLTWSVSVGTSLDPKLTIAFDVIDYALCSSSGAVIKKALTEAGIGQEIYSTWESGIRQPYFSIVAKNADPDQKDEFCRIINEVLEKQVEEGYDRKALLAAINSDEFRFREADFGRFPKGLMYGLQILDSWLYDETKPWTHIESGDIYKELKKEADSGYFEELTRKWLIDNSHGTILTLKPKKGMTEEKEKALSEKLAGIKAGMSAEEIKTIVDDTAALREYQEAPDSPEALATIPLLTRADMRRDADKLIWKKTELGGVPALVHDVFTRGIYYIDFVFDLKDVPRELIPWAGVLRFLFTKMDTEDHSYGDLTNEINIRTGGMGGAVNLYPAVVSGEVGKYFEITSKVLAENLEDVFLLTSELIEKTKFDDPSRLKEIFEEARTRAQSSLPAAGHQTAALRALSGISPSARLTDELTGIDAMRLVERLCVEVQDEARAHELAELFGSLCGMIFRPENLMIDITAPAGYLNSDLETYVRRFAEELGKTRQKPAELKAEAAVQGDFARGAEGFTTSGQVQYVALAGNFRDHGFEYTGALRVLKVMMGYDYLWQNIRVKGGAYGCMSSYRRNGDSFFVTYRDPHIKRSLDVFREAAAYVRSFEADERTLTQYIIGAVSELDVPKTPLTKGVTAMYAYLTGTTQEMVQKDRDEVLDVTGEDIRKLAELIDAFIGDGQLCVVGNSSHIEEDGDIFTHIEPLAGDGKK